MTEVSHEEAFSELAAVALDTVPPEVNEAVRGHASLCPECGPELAAMEETAAMLGHLAPQATMSPGRRAGIRSRLVMRARAESQTLSQNAIAPGRPDISRGVASLAGLGHKANTGPQRELGDPKGAATGRSSAAASRRFNWLAIAASMAIIAVGAQLFRVTGERNSMRARLAAVDTATPVTDSLPTVDSLRKKIAEKDAMITAMSGPDVMVVSLTSTSPRQTLGRMTWNRASNDWIMVTYGLKQPRSGMTYQVWLITDDARISAGTFRPDKDGRTMMRANHSLPRDALRAVAVTEEPEGGASAPTGPMVISGSA